MDEGKIFINYRLSETEDIAGRLCDHLVNEFGSDSIFLDTDNILAGIDFLEHIWEELSRASLVVVLIGDTWVEEFRNRQDDPLDYVKKELEIAYELEIPILPILIKEAEMPRAEELPKELHDLQLPRLQAARLRGRNDFTGDVARLIEEIKRLKSSRLKVSTELSFIVPMWNESDTIAATISGLIVRGLHERYSIVICDDDSTDNSFDRALKIAKNYSTISVISNRPNGKKNRCDQNGLESHHHTLCFSFRCRFNDRRKKRKSRSNRTRNEERKHHGSLF